MPLNLKNPEVESLAAEVARMANESKTEAIRKALLERRTRLAAASPPLTRSQRAASILLEFRASLPKSGSARRLTRKQEDEILGFGPDGV